MVLRLIHEHLRGRVPQREARQARALRQAIEVPLKQESVLGRAHLPRMARREAVALLQIGGGASCAVRCWQGPSHLT